MWWTKNCNRCWKFGPDGNFSERCASKWGNARRKIEFTPVGWWVLSCESTDEAELFCRVLHTMAYHFSTRAPSFAQQKEMGRPHLLTWLLTRAVSVWTHPGEAECVVQDRDSWMGWRQVFLDPCRDGACRGRRQTVSCHTKDVTQSLFEDSIKGTKIETTDSE